MGYDAASDDGKENSEPPGTIAGPAVPALVPKPASLLNVSLDTTLYSVPSVPAAPIPNVSLAMNSSAAAACANPIMGSLDGASGLALAGSGATGASSPGPVSNRGSIDKSTMALCGANGSQ